MVYIRDKIVIEIRSQKNTIIYCINCYSMTIKEKNNTITFFLHNSEVSRHIYVNVLCTFMIKLSCMQSSLHSYDKTRIHPFRFSGSFPPRLSILMFFVPFHGFFLR